MLPGTVVPPGFGGTVAAGGCAEEPVAPVELLLEPAAPLWAGQVSVSAIPQAPARMIVEMNFMDGLLVSPPCLRPRS